MLSFLLWYVNSRSKNIHWLIDRTNIYPVKNIGFSPERLFHECGIRARKQNSFCWLKETKGLISNLNKNYFISFLYSWLQSDIFVSPLRKSIFMIIFYSRRYFILDKIRKSYLWCPLFHHLSWLHVNLNFIFLKYWFPLLPYLHNWCSIYDILSNFASLNPIWMSSLQINSLP